MLYESFDRFYNNLLKNLKGKGSMSSVANFTSSKSSSKNAVNISTVALELESKGLNILSENTHSIIKDYYNFLIDDLQTYQQILKCVFIFPFFFFSN